MANDIININSGNPILNGSWTINTGGKGSLSLSRDTYNGIISPPIADIDDKYDNRFNYSSYTQLYLGDVAGGNYTYFDITGHQIMTGNARPWRDETTDALSFQQSGAGVSRNNAEGTVDFVYNATYNSNFALADSMFLNLQLNHDRDETSLIYPHIHWFQAKDYSPNFLLEYRWQVDGGVKITDWTKLKCNLLAHPYTVGTTIHQISYSLPITPPASSTISDGLQFRIFRDTTNASNEFGVNCPYNTGGNATVAVMFFDVHLQISSLGSTDQYRK
jgi:hypothetical protein